VWISMQTKHGDHISRGPGPTPDHASFDNLTFVDDRDTILVAEDRGDGLTIQLNKLDSIWAYKTEQPASGQKHRGSIRCAWPGSYGDG